MRQSNIHTHALLRLSLVAAASVLLSPACDCGGELVRFAPSLVVDPDSVILTGVPVAQDTQVVFRIPNRRPIELRDVHAELQTGSDVAFRVTTSDVDSVLPGSEGQIVVTVRPQLVSTIGAILIVTAEDDAIPNRVEVPISVSAIDVGVPDIVAAPETIAFELVGRTEVGRSSVQLGNVGARDLLIDETSYVPDVEGDASIRLTTPLPGGTPVAPGANLTLDLVFAPGDIEVHTGTLHIRSNDPDEADLVIPVSAQAAECPVAVARVVDDVNSIEPLDTVRIDGRDSVPTTPGTFIERYEWRLEQRPIGSTSVLSSTSADRVELVTDLAGAYVAVLDVFDNNGIRSCEPAIVPFNVVPKEDLHIQLVWDHPTADLDLHVLRVGGTPFTHEGDCYFSNRRPDWTPDNPDASPTLDVDDNRGYGPENTNIVRPEPGSRWTILVHYWNKQTDGDASVAATLRLFVYGQQAIELVNLFDDDQQLWRAVELVWGTEPFAQPTISQLGVVEPFARPF